ncbi:MAG: cytochrome c3 family protein [Elusimicrobiota bacterium]
MLRHRYAPLIFGILVIAGVAVWMSAFRSSPGDLAAPHAAVAGSSFVGDCRKCHDPKGMTVGCLSCHAEIAGQLDAKTGYHGKTIAAKAAACGKCHSEHNGAPFKLVNKVSWGGAEPKSFAHDHTAFALKGKHTALACADCHLKKAPPFSLPKFAATKRAETFLGLGQQCVSCHKDPHEGGKLTDCEKCHTQDAWKPATGFDHDKYYPLRDSHASVSCSKCHAAVPGAASTAVNFGPVKGKSCRDCHATPHRTDWKLACGSCHTDRAVPWNTAAARLTRAQHDLTGFRVQKPHEKVSCAKCHDPSLPYAKRYVSTLLPGRPRAEASCEACHKDPHAGQFVAKHPRCLDCHADKFFKPSRVGLKEHASVYPLVGGHAKASCASCHVKDAGLAAVRFVGSPKTCASCHKDPHVGQFRDKAGTTACEDCHRDTASWKALVFDHDRARFKLDAAHKGVTCAECHPVVPLRDGRKVVQYKPVKTGCSDCHDFKR